MDIGRIERIIDIQPVTLPVPEVLPVPEPSPATAPATPAGEPAWR